MSRTNYLIKNTFFSIMSKIVSLLLGFMSRTVFIHFLGIEYLGINGLYTEILTILSFTELGIGVAFTYALYKPIADNDEEKIAQLLEVYKNAYRIIILVVTLSGIIITPFLQYLVKGADTLSLFNLRLYFLLFLANSVASYFNAYMHSYLHGKMQTYITTNITLVRDLMMVVSQIIIIILTKSYLAYLLTHTILLLLSKIYVSVYLKRKFPILSKKPEVKLPKSERKNILDNLKGLVVHQFAGIAVNSTDNIIISSLSGLGVVAVGLISNYNLIITSVVGFVTVFFSNFTSGFGNLAALTDKQHCRKVFYEVNFINFWIYGFCAIAFYVLIPPFISIWLGKEFLIDNISFLLIIINCYLLGQSSFYHSARSTRGDFNRDKWAALLQALVNLVVSVALVKPLGLVGVYIGTVTSRLVCIIFKPLMSYKFLYGRSCSEYYWQTFVYFVIVVFVGAVTKLVVDMCCAGGTIVSLVFAFALVAVIPNCIFAVLLWRKEEFVSVRIRLKDIITNALGNIKGGKEGNI